MVRRLCVPSSLPSPPSTLYVVCCSVCMPMPNCICARAMGGVYMRMHASSVLVAMSVYVIPPPPVQVDYFFFVLYLFYQSKLERFVF